ncbi:hypothetical protein GCM10027278_17520 [Paralcaligenes ginsengisoli]
MAKGQLRGNKEAKKPKQPPKPAMPASPFGAASTKGGTQTSETKKK